MYRCGVAYARGGRKKRPGIETKTSLLEIKILRRSKIIQPKQEAINILPEINRVVRTK
jgi:hypothetical protein